MLISGFKRLNEGPAELSLGTSIYPKGLYHNVKCWMDKAAARLSEWRAADAADQQDTSRSDGSYRPKISFGEQTGEITLDIRNGREQRREEKSREFSNSKIIKLTAFYVQRSA